MSTATTTLEGCSVAARCRNSGFGGAFFQTYSTGKVVEGVMFWTALRLIRQVLRCLIFMRNPWTDCHKNLVLYSMIVRLVVVMQKRFSTARANLWRWNPINNTLWQGKIHTGGKFWRDPFYLLQKPLFESSESRHFLKGAKVQTALDLPIDGVSIWMKLNEWYCMKTFVDNNRRVESAYWNLRTTDEAHRSSCFLAPFSQVLRHIQWERVEERNLCILTHHSEFCQHWKKRKLAEIVTIVFFGPSLIFTSF